jgi:hypothetical protein
MSAVVRTHRGFFIRTTLNNERTTIMSKIILTEFKKDTGIEVTKDQLVNLRDVYEKVFAKRFEENLYTKSVYKSKQKQVSENKKKADYYHFDRWTKENLTEVKCEDTGELFYSENKDFVKVEVKTKGRPRSDYYVTQHIAELLLSRSNTTLGRSILNKLLDVFHNLEDYSHSRIDTKTGFRPLTNAIKESKSPNDKFYHYTNEVDMLNRIVTGYSAKRYKELYNVESVRDNLTPEQIKLLDKLQIHNTVMIDQEFDFETRKQKLKDFACRKFSIINGKKIDKVTSITKVS